MTDSSGRRGREALGKMIGFDIADLVTQVTWNNSFIREQYEACIITLPSITLAAESTKLIINVQQLGEA